MGIFVIQGPVSYGEQLLIYLASFHKFHCQLLHSSLVKILKSLKAGMMMPEVICFPGGYFRRVIYGLGLYMTDYL